MLMRRADIPGYRAQWGRRDLTNFRRVATRDQQFSNSALTWLTSTSILGLASGRRAETGQGKDEDTAAAGQSRAGAGTRQRQGREGQQQGIDRDAAETRAGQC